MISILFTGAAVLLTIPAMVMFVETLASLKSLHDPFGPAGQPSNAERAIILIPAHNESVGLLPTLADLKAQLGPQDRILVVADNCTDDTAAAARGAGAEVAERHDPSRIGKGYALNFGLEAMASNPPDYVICVDADCRLQADAVPLLKRACALSGRPVQAFFEMEAPQAPAVDHSPSQLFWLMRNYVRPLGMSTLGLPGQLVGTGMAFPLHALQSISLASGNLVEDLKIGIDLAQAGHPPLFYPFVRVWSAFAATRKGSESQRQRWIQGHIQLLVTDVPKLLLQGLRRGDINLIAMALDLAVPPLSLYLLCNAAVFILALLLLAFVGSASPFVLTTINFAIVFAALGLGWARHGRRILPGAALLGIPAWVLSRLAYYVRVYFGGRVDRWIRTDRSDKD